MQEISSAPLRDAGAGRTGFVRELGVLDSTMIVAGSMIGSGIFIVPAEIARQVGASGWLIMVWVVTGLLTVAAALSYGELAAMMPHAGGQYVYLRESYSPLWGFLYGWTLFLVIQTGTIAAVAVGFAKFLGVLAPAISPTAWIVAPITLSKTYAISLSWQQLVAVLLIVVLTLLNTRGIKLGKLIQNTFTSAKTLSLAALILLGLLVGRNAGAIAANFGDLWTPRNVVSFAPGLPGFPAVAATAGAFGLLVAFCVAQVGSLFSSDAWNNITFTAAEVKNPKRNLPLALAMGTGAVTLLYILANVVYLTALPLHGDVHGATILARGIQHASEDRVATAVFQQIFGGPGAKMMAFAILVSTFGCNNGLILAGARVYYAMAKDGLFFRSAAKLHPKYHTPSASLAMQCVWTCLLCISGSYSQLLDYIIFAVMVFYILTIAGLFVLRIKRPNEPRPYRAIGYPILPAMYILIATFIDVVLLRYKPQYTWPGLIIVLLGIPVYFLWSRRNPQVRGQA